MQENGYMSKTALSAIWGAMIIIMRTCGREWGFCDDIKIIKGENCERIPVNPHGADVTIGTGAIYDTDVKGR
jgi:hypothetical protein